MALLVLVSTLLRRRCVTLSEFLPLSGPQHSHLQQEGVDQVSSKVPCSRHSMSLGAGQRREEPLSSIFVHTSKYQAAVGPSRQALPPPALNHPNFGGGPQCLKILSCSPVARSLTLLQQHPPQNLPSRDPWGNQASPALRRQVASDSYALAPGPLTFSLCQERG